MDNVNLLPVLLRWWRVLLLGAALGGLAGYVVASRAAPTYAAEVRMLVGPVNTDFETLRAAGSLGRSYAELATSRPVLNFAIRETGARTTARELIEKEGVRSRSNDITRIVELTVRYGEASVAADLANTLAQRIQQLAVDPQEEATAQAAALLRQPEIQRLDREAQEAVDAAAGRVLRPSIAGVVNVVDPAVVPPEAAAPRVSLITVLAAIMGLLGVAAVVLVRESSAQRMADESVLTALEEPAYLGAVPARAGREGAPLAVETGHRSAVEKYRAIATKLGFLDNSPPVRSLLVLDATDGERSGVMAANLAAVLADAGRHVILLDANASAAGGATQALGLAGEPGFTEILATVSDPDLYGQVDQVRATRTEGFDVLPRGTEPGSGALNVEAAMRLMRRLELGAEIVLVTAAPVHVSPAALVWARVTDGTLLVVDERRTSEARLRETIGSLQFVGATLLGTVIGLAERPITAARRGAKSVAGQG
jgi:succinoglycan biosynthesis transport protein ExoP